MHCMALDAPPTPRSPVLKAIRTTTTHKGNTEPDPSTKPASAWTEGLLQGGCLEWNDHSVAA